MSNKKKLVVLTGAGISAESGLRTFRDSDGLWMNYRIEDVATPDAYKRNPKLVLDFYNMRRRDVLAAQPNFAHLEIARLENDFDVAVVTQNVDDLHERGGSTNVLHLHGEIFKMKSDRDDAVMKEIRSDIHLGDLAPDGGQWRPDIVWFGEPVPAFEDAMHIMSTANLFLLVGSSLQVYPAAGLISYVPEQSPKYIIDKIIPPVYGISNLHLIEKSATQGISTFVEKIRTEID